MDAIQGSSAWRHFPETKIFKRRVGRPRKHTELNQFYRFPVSLIAEWCCVAPSTAHGYKTGRVTPGKAAEKLFHLHRDRRILTREWEGWLVKPDCIVDPEGNETNRALLRNYQLTTTYSKELAARAGDEELRRRWASIEAA